MAEYEYALRLVRGAFDLLNDKIKVAKLSANVTWKPSRASVMNLNASGEWETGHTGRQIPYFLWTHAWSGTAVNVGTTASGGFSHASAMPGMLTAFPAIANIEVMSTYYDTTRTYAIGDFVRGIVNNSTEGTGGKLTNRNAGNSANVVPYTDPVCGVVTAAPAANEWGTSALRLWTYWVPTTA